MFRSIVIMSVVLISATLSAADTCTTLFSSYSKCLLYNSYNHCAIIAGDEYSACLISSGDTSSFNSSLHDQSINHSKRKNIKYDHIINAAAQRYNIPFLLIKSVIRQESNFNHRAVSSAGARGLMQLMPQTARSLGVANIFSPTANIMGGAKYLSFLLKKYSGNIRLTLAAYNAGPGAVDLYKKQVPPYKETKLYVKKVLKYYRGGR